MHLFELVSLKKFVYKSSRIVGFNRYVQVHWDLEAFPKHTVQRQSFPKRISRMKVSKKHVYTDLFFGTQESIDITQL